MPYLGPKGNAVIGYQRQLRAMMDSLKDDAIGEKAALQMEKADEMYVEQYSRPAYKVVKRSLRSTAFTMSVNQVSQFAPIGTYQLTTGENLMFGKPGDELDVDAGYTYGSILDGATTPAIVPGTLRIEIWDSGEDDLRGIALTIATEAFNASSAIDLRLRCWFTCHTPIRAFGGDWVIIKLNAVGQLNVANSSWVLELYKLSRWA